MSGDFKNLDGWLRRMTKSDITHILDMYAQKGVEALERNTPKRSSKTASSWYYSISKTASGYKIEWNNSNVVNGVPIALIIQLGHGTGTGGYVTGVDYINPALQPIFNEISNAISKEVSK